jgi:hypothetical protein
MGVVRIKRGVPKERSASPERRGMRLLFAYKDSYRGYSEFVQHLIQDIREVRPHLEVKAVRVEDLETEVKRFAPHMVAFIDETDELVWVGRALERC